MKTLLTFLLLFSLTNTVFAAGSDSDDTVVKPKNYSKVKKLIKKEKYTEAIEKLEEILSTKKFQNDPDIINLYAFSLRKNNNFEKSEKQYKIALDIDPKHKGALEYLGELYVNTGRIEQANQILAKLAGCKCKEYSRLEGYISGKKYKKLY